MDMHYDILGMPQITLHTILILVNLDINTIFNIGEHCFKFLGIQTETLYMNVRERCATES
jgi:hypothetical protein